MPAPNYVTASTGGTDAMGAWTGTCHAPSAADQIIILQFLQDGATAGAVGFTSATNIKNLAGTANQWTAVLTQQAIGSPTSAFQFVYIGRSTSTSAPTFTGSNSTSEDIYYRFYEFANVNPGTTLATVIENSTAGTATNGAGTSGTIADTDVVTLGPNRLALNFVAINDDNAVAAFTGMTGGTWAEATAEYAEASGTDGCLQLQTATMGIAGTIGSGTASNPDATDGWGVIGFALIGIYDPRNPAMNFQDPAVV